MQFSVIKVTTRIENKLHIYADLSFSSVRIVMSGSVRNKYFWFLIGTTGGWMGPRAGLDVCKLSRPHRESIPGPYST
jgi:hypothetical protein